MMDYIRLRGYEMQRAEIMVAEAEERTEAYKNAVDAYHDGLKYVGDDQRDKPFKFVSPMHVYKNLFYTRNGIRYVSFYEGIVSDETFDDLVKRNLIIEY